MKKDKNLKGQLKLDLDFKIIKPLKKERRKYVKKSKKK